jgi:hypothetical protein
MEGVFGRTDKSSEGKVWSLLPLPLVTRNLKFLELGEK